MDVNPVVPIGIQRLETVACKLLTVGRTILNVPKTNYVTVPLPNNVQPLGLVNSFRYKLLISRLATSSHVRARVAESMVVILKDLGASWVSLYHLYCWLVILVFNIPGMF